VCVEAAPPADEPLDQLVNGGITSEDEEKQLEALSASMEAHCGTFSRCSGMLKRPCVWEH
jgi:hypothetical protein